MLLKCPRWWERGWAYLECIILVLSYLIYTFYKLLHLHSCPTDSYQVKGLYISSEFLFFDSLSSSIICLKVCERGDTAIDILILCLCNMMYNTWVMTGAHKSFLIWTSAVQMFQKSTTTISALFISIPNNVRTFCIFITIKHVLTLH